MFSQVGEQRAQDGTDAREEGEAGAGGREEMTDADAQTSQSQSQEAAGVMQPSQTERE